MGWVRQTAEEAVHECAQPSREGLWDTAVGSLGDLWRCDACGALWRVGLACSLCDRHRSDRPHAGQHAVGLMWRPATWWQHWKHRKTPTTDVTTGRDRS